jgi:site-specific DNA-methyltransferase (adenine-specific)
MLREYVKVGEVEKKKFGEVMTPLELVKEMLSKLPEEVWSNPNLKWLDPANGTGPFPTMVIYKLMDGLKEWEPDDEKRYRHIVENMIYVCELQPKNMFLWLCAIDPWDKYKLNIYCGSFLDEGFDKHMKEVWGVEKFDIVIGNPPYNQMIDMDFVSKSYNISDYLIFVHPSTWLLDEKRKQKKFIKTKELIENHLEKIILFNGNKIFGIQLFVPCVITMINRNKKNSRILCIDRINNCEIYYSDIRNINKFSNIDTYPSIKSKIENISTIDNFLKHKDVIYGEYYVNISQIRGHVDLKSDTNMLMDDFYTIVTRDESVSNKKNKHMFYSFKTHRESVNFLNFLKTNFCRFCLSIYKNNSQLDRGEMEIIPWLDFTIEWDDEKLSEYFSLSKIEIDFINKNIPPYYD